LARVKLLAIWKLILPPDWIKISCPAEDPSSPLLPAPAAMPPTPPVVEFAEKLIPS
jgi:hypothetical protein